MFQVAISLLRLSLLDIGGGAAKMCPSCRPVSYSPPYREILDPPLHPFYIYTGNSQSVSFQNYFDKITSHSQCLSVLAEG